MMRALGMACALVLAALVFAANGASAHTRSQSASDWRIDGNRIEGSFSIDARRATLLYGLAEEDADLQTVLIGHLGETIHVNQGGAVCAAASAPIGEAAADGFLRARLSFVCPEGIIDNGVAIDAGAFFDLSAAHLHIIRIRNGEDLLVERVLSGTNHLVDFGAEGAGPSRASAFTSFVRTGMTHVLSGWDHLAFLAALLLLAGRLKPIIATITGFTVGHSLTMALVALGVLRPYGIAIEVLIGFSIAYAAMEAGARGLTSRDRLWIWGGTAAAGVFAALLAVRMGQAWPPVIAMIAMCWFVASQAPGRWSREGWSWRAPALAMVFGLAHGAGFAGALLEYDLSGPGLLLSLLGFNVGVELGQLFAVTVILALVAGLRRVTVFDLTLMRNPVAAGLFGLGVFWTVSRLMVAA